jgi:peptide/nickel transport system ATP-binding protein
VNEGYELPQRAAELTADEPTTGVLLQVKHLVQRYKVSAGTLEAVSDVSFQLQRGETLGLVGESGCGKSSTARAVLQLPGPTSGQVIFDGTDLTTLSTRRLREVRRKLQIIFQDPLDSLNPRRRIRDVVGEGFAIAGQPRSSYRDRVDELLTLVALDPDDVGDRRSHELSGGQCQRVAIARALALDPHLLVCDEPVAALDVSVRGQVLNILREMQSRLGLSLLFISHDLSVVHNVSDRIAVMYLGRIVETGPSEILVGSPGHPYTRALIDAIPTTEEPERKTAAALKGEIPSPLKPPSGCRFRTRCPIAQQICADKEPWLTEVADNHFVSCHFPLVAA